MNSNNCQRKGHFSRAYPSKHNNNGPRSTIYMEDAGSEEEEEEEEEEKEEE